MQPNRPISGIESGQDQKVFDVIVVGASLAGCTAARLFALQGLQVALVELHRDPGSFKQLCTHFIQASATPTLVRLGLDRLIEKAGGIRNGVDIWTRYGWTGEEAPHDAAGRPAFGYNIRRSRLDPIIRELVTQTPGVTLWMGCPVRGLVRESGQICGVQIGGAQGSTLRARLVVAADGRNSSAATLTGVQPKIAPNCRAGAFQAYRGVVLRRAHCSQMWFHEGDVIYVFPNEDEITVLACMPMKEKLDAFRGDAENALRSYFSRLPDAPDLTHATPVGGPVVVKEYENQWRPATIDGMALVGDALMSIDPLWGVGCGFAFQTAEWLVDSLSDMLSTGVSVDAGLQRYANTVSRRLGGHRFLINDFSGRGDFNAVERLMFAAAAKNRSMSRHLHAFGARMIGPARFLSPGALLRATWVNLSRPVSPSAAASARH